jgi:PAS domain S-box-containing protein
MTRRPERQTGLCQRPHNGIFQNRTGVELIGETWQGRVHPDDLGECLARWTHFGPDRRHYEVELRLRRHDGVFRWHQATATCGRDEHGKITKWFGTNTDIDDQKQSEEKLNFLCPA